MSNITEYEFRGKTVSLNWNGDGDWWLYDDDADEPIDDLTADETYKIGNLVLEIRMDRSEP